MYKYFIWMIFLCSCEQTQRNNPICIVTNGDSIIINLYENGYIQSIEKKDILSNKRSGDQLYFREDGSFLSKIRYNNDKKNGIAYYYYPSGYEEAFRAFQDDNIIGDNLDFYDTSMNIKSLLLYNNTGQLFYRQTFSKDGSTINIEGKLDSAFNISIKKLDIKK